MLPTDCGGYIRRLSRFGDPWQSIFVGNYSELLLYTCISIVLSYIHHCPSPSLMTSCMLFWPRLDLATLQCPYLILAKACWKNFDLYKKDLFEPSLFPSWMSTLIVGRRSLVTIILHFQVSGCLWVCSALLVLGGHSTLGFSYSSLSADSRHSILNVVLRMIRMTRMMYEECQL